MCGIAGILNHNGLAPDPAVIRRMVRRIAHRGPDAQGHHVDPCTHLGACRLSIIDLTGGAQPWHGPDGRWTLVYNGEIYNYRDLRTELAAAGHRFVSRSDTEVLLAAYLQWGADCVTHLRGMFAFAVWDAHERKLFAARDRMGIKPFYYAALSDGTLVFGSEIKALLAHPGVVARPDLKALERMLTFGFNLAPHTFFSGIRQLLPGHHLTATPAGRRITQYWDIDLDAPVLEEPDEAIVDRLRAELQRAVTERLVADVPVAAYLSGGIDSSAVTAMYSRASREPVHTVSITFDDAGYDERRFSRLAAHHVGARNTEFRCRLTAGEVPRLIAHLEEPMMTLLNLPLLLLSEQVRRRGLRVVLSGDGADEVFGGYDYFKLLKIMRFCARADSPARRGLLRRVFPGLATPVQVDLRYALLADCPEIHPALPYRFQRFGAMERLLAADLQAELARAPMENPFWFDHRRLAHRSLVDQALYMDARMRLLNLTLPLADKMSMANSVEARPVFLDHDLVNLAFRIPDRLKIRGLNEKYVFKQAMRGVLPQEICRRRKQPLQPPAVWFVRTFAELVGDTLSPAAVRRKGYFDTDFVGGALEAFREQGRADTAPILVVAFFVHLWDELFIQSASARPQARSDPWSSVSGG